MVFLACVHLALFLALSLSPGSSPLFPHGVMLMPKFMPPDTTKLFCRVASGSVCELGRTRWQVTYHILSHDEYGRVRVEDAIDAGTLKRSGST